jgi:hypothetical protein
MTLLGRCEISIRNGDRIPGSAFATAQKRPVHWNPIDGFEQQINGHAPNDTAVQRALLSQVRSRNAA